MKNYYEILEVDVKVSKEMLDKAFKLLAKRYHPDTKPDDKKEWAEEKFKEINEAYEVLSNEDSKKDYDAELDYDKNSAVEAIIAKNEHLQHLVEELQNEISYLKSQANTETTNFSSSSNIYENDNLNNYQYEINQNSNSSYNSYYNVAPEETLYYETRIPYRKSRLKDILAFLITIICIIVIRIFTMENTFYK